MNWWKTVFSEQDGVGSWARVGSLGALASSIAWGTYVVLKTHVMPDLLGATAFVSTIYGLNKAHDFLTSKTS